ncbi:hypothetical protein BD779DRAFT_1477680 [Infundibulicybe gibba]|nr:hypothetical protein BD779DRAFT_1477680 [Infundibulicybe gibba]
MGCRHQEHSSREGGTTPSHKLGIFRDWGAVEPLISNFRGCRHKSFTTDLEARKYWHDYCREAHDHTASIPPPMPTSTPETPQSPGNSSQPVSMRPDEPTRRVFYIVRPTNLHLPGASLYSNRSTALAALVNTGNGWELLGMAGLEQVEREVLRSV